VGRFNTTRCGFSLNLKNENMKIDSTFQNEKRPAMQNEVSPSLFCRLYPDLVALFMWHHGLLLSVTDGVPSRGTRFLGDSGKWI
jgi:hypothetical protein